MSAKYLKNFFAVYILLSTDSVYAKVARQEVDKVIEDEITYKLADDLIQSIEKKFHVDLERSLDMILTRIHLLLQNGTRSTQEKFMEMRALIDDMRAKAPAEIDGCLQQRVKETTSLAEKALHQMVVCGYALIGQDPGVAVHQVHTLKDMIREEVKSMNAQKKGIYELLRVCGHEHESLRKVIKCVISKSPSLKSVMMSVTGKLVNGIVELTKTLAHGAMHEACLIEVLKTTEEEAADILDEVKKCAFNGTSLKVTEGKPVVEEGKIVKTSKVDKEDENKEKGTEGSLKSKSNKLVDVKNDLTSLNTVLFRENID